MAKREWLFCNDEWFDLINIIKTISNPAERLQKFQRILEHDHMDIIDVTSVWAWRVITKEEISDEAKNQFFIDDATDYLDDETIYWFFNIYTGEAMHIKYSVKVICSGIIVD